MAKRKTYRKKSTARRAGKRSHRSVYPVKGGYRLCKKGHHPRRRRRSWP